MLRLWRRVRVVWLEAKGGLWSSACHLPSQGDRGFMRPFLLLTLAPPQSLPLICGKRMEGRRTPGW